MNQVRKILHEHLTVKKLCTRWIPHNLTEAQKLHGVNWCREMIAGGDSNTVDNIVTGDESWIYWYDLETKKKKQSAQWVFAFEELPTKIFGVIAATVNTIGENFKCIASTALEIELCDRRMDRQTDSEVSAIGSRWHPLGTVS
ncbi:hypothetical protein EVAR_7116_1 [Eumeta japonica]|uniref:Mariner Mos1 transposase n=1 Tax=Eumeta variegata TaxID=151549 RepID=A0A4C1U6A6_EUMVA|nr:hypothetical protein EVAR_7116_1 [Eumeta japonica]